MYCDVLRHLDAALTGALQAYKAAFPPDGVGAPAAARLAVDLLGLALPADAMLQARLAETFADWPR